MIKRGDIFRARLDASKQKAHGGERPVVVMSRDALNQNSPVVVVVPIAEKDSKKRIYPSQFALKAGDGGLATDSVVLGERVRAIDTDRLEIYLGHLSPQSIVNIGGILRIVLDL